MQSIKFIILFLAILIALALGLLVYGFANKIIDPNWQLFTKRPLKPEAYLKDQEKIVFGDVFLKLPKNHVIKKGFMRNQSLFIITGPYQIEDNKIFVLDGATGRILGSVNR